MSFFEGEDFKTSPFKALMPEFYPAQYREYIKQETELLKRAVTGHDRVLEAGVGIGRLIPELAPLVKEFIGVDNANLMISQAKIAAKNFNNVKIIMMDLEDLSQFSSNYFDISLCVWNTLGNVNNEVSVITQLKRITKDNIILTVYKKGTVEQRKNWYKIVGIDLDKIDEENEIFYSKSGLHSKSYNVADLEKLATRSELKIKHLKELAGVMLWAELS